MTREPNPQKQIAAFPSARANFALPGQTDALSLVHATGDFYLIGFHFVRTAASQGDGALRSMQSFFERDHNVRFDITAAFRAGRSLPKATESRATLPPTEKCFEEIAEAGAAKFELDPAVPAAVTMKPSAMLSASPTGRRLKSSRLIPIRAELIVFLPLLRIA